jgi:hypothetical protein
VNGDTQLMEGSRPAVDGAGLLDQACWYAVRTRSRHEKLVARQLETQGIESFLPVVTQTHNWSDRRKQVETPLFSGYAFLRMIHSSDERVRVLRTQGVVSFVGVHGTGTPIPDHQIEDIKTLVASRVPYRSACKSPGRSSGWHTRHSGGGEWRSQPGDFSRADPAIVVRPGRRLRSGSSLIFLSPSKKPNT